MCVVCCGSPKAPDEDCPEWDESLRGESQLDWLNHYVGIIKDEDLIPLGAYLNYSNFECIEGNPNNKLSFGCATYFRTGNSEGIPWDDGPYGLACHEKCYRLLQQELGYTIKFGDVWPLLLQQEDLATNWLGPGVTDYGGMARYAGEFFRYQMLCADGNAWMLRDPSTEKANAERIVKVWRALLAKGFPVTTNDEPEPESGVVSD